MDSQKMLLPAASDISTSIARTLALLNVTINTLPLTWHMRIVVVIVVVTSEDFYDLDVMDIFWLDAEAVVEVVRGVAEVKEDLWDGG